MEEKIFDQILAPSDGSDPANAALEYAINIASQYDADLHVLVVTDLWDAYERDELPPDATDPDMIFEDAVSRLADTDLTLHEAVARGPTDDAILEYATEHEIDLIAMGTHGRSGIDRLLVGSVAESVIRNASIPVMTTHCDT